MKKIFIVVPQYIDKKIAHLLTILIRLYQKTISPDHSSIGKGNHIRTCKFYPTCSEYGIRVLEQQGFFFGIWKILWRIIRCHPWSKGGVDMPDKTL
jgi:putative membrane protein insertion efficiency factor